jgi:hypothetical protein
MTPLQYQKGVTPDISSYLQFTFWQPVLYLDHEAEWPSSKERSGRWIGIAQGFGDILTFWILDDQSKLILARSVVRPFTENLRVKWDPALADITDVDLDVISDDCTNVGMDTSQLEVPFEGPISRAKGKLILDNDKIDIDESIDQYTRTKKQAYKEVRYKDKKHHQLSRTQSQVQSQILDVLKGLRNHQELHGQLPEQGKQRH